MWRSSIPLACLTSFFIYVPCSRQEKSQFFFCFSFWMVLLRQLKDFTLNCFFTPLATRKEYLILLTFRHWRAPTDSSCQLSLYSRRRQHHPTTHPPNHPLQHFPPRHSHGLQIAHFKANLLAYIDTGEDKRQYTGKYLPPIEPFLYYCEECKFLLNIVNTNGSISLYNLNTKIQKLHNSPVRVACFFPCKQLKTAHNLSAKVDQICHATDAKPRFPLHLITAQCQLNKFIYIILIKQANGNCHPKSQPVCQGQVCVCLSVCLSRWHRWEVAGQGWPPSTAQNHLGGVKMRFPFSGVDMLPILVCLTI